MFEIRLLWVSAVTKGLPVLPLHDPNRRHKGALELVWASPALQGDRG